ncbi:MAG: hypothetical protein K2Y22_09030 [Candidatus Obscuribacterales bacterium]|nr:hypothetical protein [Candidatus Obscuribacterales bacterium]
MRTKSNIALLVLILLATAISLDLQFSGEALAKPRTVKKRSRNYLVPPPPPVVLPAAYSMGHGIYQAPVKKNPYKKYVYCREGYEDPTPTKVNKHVTYWN